MFQTPTGPTLLIVRHISVNAGTSFRLGTHLLILLHIVLVTLVEWAGIEPDRSP